MLGKNIVIAFGKHVDVLLSMKYPVLRYVLSIALQAIDMLSLLSLLTCIVAAELVPQPTEYQIHGQRINSHAWTKQSKPEFERIIPIKIALAQQNLEKGSEWLDEVSNPASNSYGKHWTPEQVIEAFRPQ